MGIVWGIEAGVVIAGKLLTVSYVGLSIVLGA